MDTNKFNYYIEVHLSSRNTHNPDKPYFWNIWEERKDGGNGLRTNAGAGWASTPAAAWQEAYRYFSTSTEVSLSEKVGIVEVYQIKYQTKSGKFQHGNVFCCRADAAEYALSVDFVSVNGEVAEVESFEIVPVKLIPTKSR